MKTKSKKSTPKARITSIGVSRLYNLGNYQNVKYDLCAEVPEGVSARKVLLDLSKILIGLKPTRRPDEADYLKTALAKPEAARSDWEKSNMKQWTEIAEAFGRKLARQEKASKALDDLGGSTLKKDAKENWEDNEEY